MSSSSSSDGNSIVKYVLLAFIAIIAGFFAIKLTFWAIKWALVLAVVGVVGYVGYSVVTGLLSSDEKDEHPKLLPPKDADSSPADDPMRELNEALRELEELKKMRGE